MKKLPRYLTCLRHIAPLALLSACPSGGAQEQPDSDPVSDDAMPGRDGGDQPGQGGAGQKGMGGAGMGGASPISGDLPALDVVFVVDNSGSMKEEIESLKANVPVLIEELSRFSGGIPDLQVAVVRPDLGGVVGLGCTSDGDEARFFHTPSCQLQGSFLKQPRSGAGNNFTRSLPETITCLLDVGSQGCFHQQPLLIGAGSVSKRVVYPEQAAFLRPEAALLMVIVSNDDDCSGLSLKIPEDNHEPRLQCALEGHSCGGFAVDRVRYTRVFSDCKATTDSRNIESINDLVKFFRELKPDGRLMVSVIAGWPDDPETAQYRLDFVESNGKQVLDVMPVCRTAMGDARPALRLKAFAEAMGDQASFHSICHDDMRPALRSIARLAQSRMMD